MKKIVGRTYKDWLKNAEQEKERLPKHGEHVVVLEAVNVLGHHLYRKKQGKFIFAWNNIGRLIDKDGNSFMVSTRDIFYKDI